MITEKNILYEDDDVLVINKPAGMLTVPTPKKEKYTLTSCLGALLRGRGFEGGVYPCHRLDRDTSGLIIYAKKKSVQDAMMQQFRDGQVRKAYIAFVSGILKRPSGVISFPVENKKAVTKYKLLQKRKGYSIIEAAPTTGRTNQIRIHFATIGHPLLGERQFAFGKDFRVKFRRVALHACRLEFKHPTEGKFVRFAIPLPDDMSRFAGTQLREFIEARSIVN